MRLGAAGLLCLAISAVNLNADAKLALKVTPAMAMAPAYVRVQATVGPDADNRVLKIVAQSSEFYRATEIELHGDSGPRVQIIEFPAMPSGFYEVSATLHGGSGQRAAATALLRVAPAPGQR
jgi:hypothetical protein